jgi:ferredoxin
MDCTYCFNCVRACPYDNVALRLREPGRELVKDPWRTRGGATVLLFGVLLAVWGVMNALAMIGPFQALADAAGTILGTHRRWVLILVLYLVASVVGVALTGAFALLADLAGGAPPRPRRAFRRWGYVAVALGFGFWTAHYLFHFLTGGAGAVPVAEHFLDRFGAGLAPNWGLDRLVPMSWLFPIQAVVTALYAVLAMVTALRIGLRDFGRRGAVAMWPMLLFALLFAAVQVLVLSQPMQMRGTMMMGPGG